MDKILNDPLLQSPIYPMGMAIILAIAYLMTPAATRGGMISFVLRFVKDHWRAVALGTLGWLFAGSIRGLQIFGAVFVLSKLFGRVNPTSKARRHFAKRAAQDATELQETLGSTPEACAEAIRGLFDQQSGTWSVTRWHEVKGAQGAVGFLGFRISRSLAAMDTRERELLRAVESMRHVSGTIDDQWYGWAKFGLLWGGGKATIDEWQYQIAAASVRDGPSAVNWYMSQMDAGVDSVVTAVLRRLDNTEGKAKPGLVAGAPIKDRLVGADVWLRPGDIPNTPYAPKSEHQFVIGPVDGTGTMLTYSGPGSLITIAPPQSGKTQCHVFPNLLTWRGPAVVLDVSGEIYDGTSKWRSENVGPVYRFSPLDPARSHCYNPLSFVRRESDYIWQDARLLADMIVVPSDKSADPFWETKARDVVAAAIAHVCYGAPPDQRPMQKVVDIVYGGPAWEEMIVGLQMAVDVRAMMQQGTSLGGMNEKTRDSVLQTAQNSLSAWSGEMVNRATQRSDWSPLDLRSGKNPTIYICLKPSEIDSYVSVMRVFIAQHIRMLTSEIPPRGSQPILFMLDELPRLRYMPPVEEAIEIGAKYGLRLWMIAQSLGQLEKAYPNAEGMVGSCAVRVFMNPSAHDGTAEKVSEEIGYREAALDGKRVRVVEAAELAGPTYRDVQIVLAAGAKPVKVRKAPAWQNKDLEARMGRVEPGSSR